MVRAGLPGWGLLAVGTAAGVLLILTEVSHIRYITTLTASCDDLAGPRLRDSCLIVGHESHHWGFAILGLFVVLMTFGAAVGKSRPASYALLAAGLIALAITLLKDLPDTTRTGQVGVAFADATAHKGTGFWLELIGSVLAIAAGAFALVRRPQIVRAADVPAVVEPVEPEPEPEPVPQEEALAEKEGDEEEAAAAERSEAERERQREERVRAREKRRRERPPRERERKRRAEAEKAEEEAEPEPEAAHKPAKEVDTEETEALSLEDDETY